MLIEIQQTQSMNESREKEIKRYLKYGILPEEFSSNKSNFIALASNYILNKKNKLMRDGKQVVTEKMQLAIYEAFHQHSGRTSTWNKIKSR